MGRLERAAVLARSRGAKKTKIGENPSWYLTEEKINEMRKKAFSSVVGGSIQERVTDIVVKAEAETENNDINTISGDSAYMRQLGVPLKVAQIISFVGNQNLSSYGIDKDLLYEDHEVVLRLLENGLDVYDKFCANGMNFNELHLLDKHMLIFTWKKGFLGEEKGSILENNILPLEIAKCVQHYPCYDFQDFYDYTNNIIQDMLG